MLDKTPKPAWTRMEDATKEDFLSVMDYEDDFNAGLVDRLLDALRSLDEDWTPYPINRYQHSLQSATLAHEDGADEELIVAALLHDIGDTLSPYNHGELVAAIIKPYVSEKTRWIVQHHCVFQGHYYNHHLGGDRLAREKYKNDPYYDDCVYFCHNYDQNAFDPDYPSKSLEFFEPMLRRIFSKKPGHLELNEKRDNPTE